MKKCMILIVICLFCKLEVNAKDYAILISAGRATCDDVVLNSEYWYDLFLAYEDLVLKEGYDPANVFVFYGNGTNFVSSRPRYQLSLHGWTSIVNFNNNYPTLCTQFANLGSIITNNDNLLIRWVVGHGLGNAATTPTTLNPGRFPINNDDYWVKIEWGPFLYVRETEIIRIIDQIPNYKRRKIIWMTCHSGCLATGTNNLNNSKTVLITSSNWDQVSSSYNLPGETIHAQLNYVVTSSLYGQDPLGATFNADNNGDNVVNMYELWNKANGSPIVTSDPQLGNIYCANMTYVDEGLQLTNISMPSGTIEYDVSNLNTQNVAIQNSSNVTMRVNEFNATGTFYVPTATNMTIKH